MVYYRTRGHFRVAMLAKAWHGYVPCWPARMVAMAMLLGGFTTQVETACAQPSNLSPPPRVTELPLPGLEPAPAPSPLVRQDEPPPKALPSGDKLPADVKLPKGNADLPAPVAIPPFGPQNVRMPRLPEGPGFLGATPRATEEQLKEFNQFVDRIIDPAHTFDLIEGRTRIIILKKTPTRIQVADDGIIGHNLLEPTQMIVIGRKTGSTVMTMWFTNDANKEIILSYLVRVLPDPEAKMRLELVYKALEKEIHKQFPDSKIKLTLVGDRVAVSGESKDIQQATQILRIVRDNAPHNTTRLPINNLNVNVQAGDLLNPAGTPGLDSFITAGGPNVINLITIPGEQQVMLRVTVAEVNRTAARSIGVDFTFTNNHGLTVVSQLTGGITIPSGGLSGATSATGGGGVTANIPVLLDHGQLPLAINALKTLNYARSLAEPNLTALNGQTASFQAGGSFPVPVVGGFGASAGGSGGLQGVQFVPYGVLLNFTPFITDRDRIRLQMQATVSSRDTSTGSSINGSSVSGLSSRNFSTTVEMRDGQTMAVAGLIQNNLASQSTRIPFLGNIPILNRFMGYDAIQSGEQELVVLITPELVSPLEKKEVSKVPGSDLFEPSDLEFFVCGRLESKRTTDYRSQTMNDPHRMIKYHKAEQMYLFGPVGHTDDPNYPYDPYDRYGREIRSEPGLPPQPAPVQPR